MPAKRRRGSASRYAPYIRAAGGLYRGFRQFTALRNRYRGYGSQTRTRNSVQSSQGVTSQYDRKLIYRKRRMPKGKRVRWRRFVQKVHAAQEKDLGSKTTVFNNQIVGAYNTTTYPQGVWVLGLYTLQDATYPYLNDLQEIYNNVVTKNDQTTKLAFQSAILDVTFTNMSVNAAGTVYLPAEVDVYEMTANRQFMVNGSAQNLWGIFNNASTVTGPIGTYDPSIPNQYSRGVTPWDLPEALSEFGIKIWKKTKFIMSPRDTATYQVRDPKRRALTAKMFDDLNGNNLPKVTRFLYFVYKIVPGFENSNDSVSLNFGCTRKYLFKVISDAVDQDAYLALSS